MEKMDELAKSEDDGSKKLAVACVAQIRFLERIVDSSAMYKSIFDRYGTFPSFLDWLFV